MANNQPSQIELGVCSVTYKGVDLGYTIGGVTVTYKPTYHKTRVDQNTGVVEGFLIEEDFMAELNLAEFVLGNLQAAMTLGTTQGDDSISFGSKTGRRVSTSGGVLILHPIARAANDRNADVTLYKAVNMSEVKIEHKNDGEKVIPCTFEALSDVGRSDGDQLGYIGDSIS